MLVASLLLPNLLLSNSVILEESFENLRDISTKENNATEIIHGHTLPPEPDPTINNATLGGVDSNGNGVRDDVERAIYKKYDNKLDAVFLMDNAKFFQRTLVEPLINAKEIAQYDTKTIDCRVFLSKMDKKYKYITFREHIDYVQDLILNTQERIQKYWDYNIALSGGVYGSSVSDWALKSCSQEIKDTLTEMQQ